MTHQLDRWLEPEEVADRSLMERGVDALGKGPATLLALVVGVVSVVTAFVVGTWVAPIVGPILALVVFIVWTGKTGAFLYWC